jgi:hypothetical protein
MERLNERKIHEIYARQIWKRRIEQISDDRGDCFFGDIFYRRECILYFGCFEFGCRLL